MQYITVLKDTMKELGEIRIGTKIHIHGQLIKNWGYFLF